MEDIHLYISNKLRERQEKSSLRSLPSNNQLIDFCSNDYLGFARSARLRQALGDELNRHPVFPIGSTGSRLISGNDGFTELLESEIAAFHGSEAALVFNSGYDANVGLFSSIAGRGDTIILDEFIHASILDGARLSFANKYSFKHNCLNSLEDKLKLAKGKILIGVESIYSMDGDTAPLADMVTLAEKYHAALIVDEAHAVGILGDQGKGLVAQLGVSDRIFARVITFGKALGCHGAAVLGSLRLREYLVNFARSFIYTTSASYLSHLSVRLAYEELKSFNNSELHRKIGLFREQLTETSFQLIESASPIQSLLIPGNIQAKALAARMQEAGFDVRAILHPTVAAGSERLRICLHIFNTDDEIIKLSQLIRQ